MKLKNIIKRINIIIIFVLGLSLLSGCGKNIEDKMRDKTEQHLMSTETVDVNTARELLNSEHEFTRMMFLEDAFDGWFDVHYNKETTGFDFILKEKRRQDMIDLIKKLDDTKKYSDAENEIDEYQKVRTNIKIVLEASSPVKYVSYPHNFWIDDEKTMLIFGFISDILNYEFVEGI